MKIFFWHVKNILPTNLNIYPTYLKTKINY